MEKFTKKLVTLATGAMLTHSIGDAKLPARDFSAGAENKNKNESVIRKTPEISSQGTVDFASHEIASDAAEISPNSETGETPSASNIEFETANESVVASSAKAEDVAPVPEKTKTVESVAETAVDISPETFSGMLQGLLKDIIEKKGAQGFVKIESIKVNKNIDDMVINAQITVLGMPVSFIGNISASGPHLSLDNQNTKAPLIIRNKVTKALDDFVPKALADLEKTLEQKYRDAHPNGINKLSTQGGTLKAFFK